MRVNSSLGKQSTNSVLAQVGYYLRQKLHYFHPRRYLCPRLGLTIAGLTLFLSTFTSITISSLLFATLVYLVSERMRKNEVAKLSVSLSQLVSILAQQKQALQMTNQKLHQELWERQKTEQFLRESQQQFRQIAENIEEIFWIASFEFNQLLYVSPAYEKIFGRSCDLLYQDPTSWLELIHHQDRKRLKTALEIHKKKAQPINIKFRIVLPNGTVRWLWSQTFPVKNQQNKFYRSTGVVVDITQQKQAEAEMYQSK
ncbi:MAG: PAS domain-containing protein [Symploca sp. SIO3E6]|nr:PAS domain-containing protein [Caldora sp. SIO3E6]